MDEELVRQLAHLRKYGELVERQQELIERQDYEALLAVVDKKDKVLARMGDPSRMRMLAERAAGESGGDAGRNGELLAEVVDKLNFFSGREAEDLEKASGLKAELAEGIYSLRKGKRMLRKYSQGNHTGKARFKDVRG